MANRSESLLSTSSQITSLQRIALLILAGGVLVAITPLFLFLVSSKEKGDYWD